MTIETGQMRWVQVSTDDEWHIIREITQSDSGIPMVTTKCGITEPWSQTFLDRLPGGDDSAGHDECLAAEAAETADEEPAPKRGKTK
jgi:hypothetical protein